jgi:hypothetical protein
MVHCEEDQLSGQGGGTGYAIYIRRHPVQAKVDALRHRCVRQYPDIHLR